MRLIGDVPIYVAPGGADHLAWPELFRAACVAGVPPDAFTAKGQLWGNPLFDWPALRRRRYRWWVERLRRTFELFDVTRIDHFRGFVAYWAVPEGAPDAVARPLAPRAGAGGVRRGARVDARRPLARHRRGPRRDHPAGDAAAPRRSGFPGMVVLQFGFDPDDPQSPHHPDAPRGATASSTPGTHDNDTALGWWRVAGRPDAASARSTARRRPATTRRGR